MKKQHTLRIRRTHSLQVKMGITIIFLTTVVLFGFGMYQYRTRQKRELARLEAFAQNVTEQLAINLIFPIWNFDERLIERVVDVEMQDDRILAVVVKDAEQTILARKTRDDEWNVIDADEDLTAELPTTSREILEGEKPLGSVEVYLTQRFVQAELNRALREIGIIVIVLDILLFILLLISMRLLLVRPLSRLLRLATAMSDGDFQQVIEIHQQDEIGALAEAFRTMQATVSKVVQQVQAAATGVTVGSQQLQESAVKMSQGSSQQSASAEEISSSMEEMMANINQNADNAQQTEQIAVKAASDAQESGKAVMNAVSAMQKIAENISVIEEIANRTHILSMNASIEASKAQEYGKGFGVVASEVRTLAIQSQDAAKEINALAHSTVDLSETAGELLNRLVPDIQHTAELIQEISAASQEQRSGAKQIAQAMQQLDQVAQQHAVTAEETASTAEEFASQAEQLQNMIAFFKLPEAPQASQDEWKTLLDMLQTVPDEDARAQILTAIGKVMAVKDDRQEVISPLKPSRKDTSKEYEKNTGEEQDTMVGTGLDRMTDEDGKDDLDSEFEKY